MPGVVRRASIARADRSGRRERTQGAPMTTPESGARVLVVANRTASTPMLLDEIGRRARAGARIALVVPHEGGDEDWTEDDALRLVSDAAGQPVEALDAGDDALDTIHRAVDDDRFDAIIVSTVPHHFSRWVHHDLPHRLKHLGLPVTVIAPEPDVPVPDHVKGGLPADWEYATPSPGIETF
jgi:hypothetical protein